MKYTIEYLENGAREWQRFELTPRAEWVAFVDFRILTEAEQSENWEAARLVETDQCGRERKLAEWAPEVQELGVSLRAQLLEIEEDADRLSKKVAKVLSDYK
jgi:hypothetical protein